MYTTESLDLESLMTQLEAATGNLVSVAAAVADAHLVDVLREAVRNLDSAARAVVSASDQWLAQAQAEVAGLLAEARQEALSVLTEARATLRAASASLQPSAPDSLENTTPATTAARAKAPDPSFGATEVSVTAPAAAHDHDVPPRRRDRFEFGSGSEQFSFKRDAKDGGPAEAS